MQYEIEITAGSKPAQIDVLTVAASSATEAAEIARSWTGNNGRVKVKVDGLYVPLSQAQFLEAMRADEMGVTA